jgi:hypothetical protein
MLYREIIAVCSQIRTKHINTVCGQNVGLLNVKLVVHIASSKVIGAADEGKTSYLVSIIYCNTSVLMTEPHCTVTCH